MRFSDLCLSIRNMLSDYYGQTWDEDTVALAVIYACKDYAKKTRATRYHYDSLPGADGEFATPGDYLQLVHVDYDGKELVKSDHDFESLKSQTWETDTATLPKRWILFGGSTIKLIPQVTGWDPTTDGSFVTGATYTIKTIGTTDWTIAGGTGATGVTGYSFLAVSAGGTGTGTAWGTPSSPTCTIEYVQSPTPVSTTGNVDTAALVVGTSYEITALGGTGIDWTTVGATGSITGATFVATGSTTAGGTAVEILDVRIPEKYQEYLKYAAANYLLRMKNDEESIAKADKFLTDYNALIGPMQLF